MRRRHSLLVVLFMLVAIGLLSSGSVALASGSGLGRNALRRTPAPTHTPVPPTPSPAATPIPPATCWATVPGPTLPGNGAVLNDVAGSGPQRCLGRW